MRDARRLVMYLLVSWGILYGAAECMDRASAENAWPVFTPETKQDLARCLMGEADVSAKDWEAASWCLVKQWRAQPYGRDFRGQVRAYCALFDKGSKYYYRDRSRWIRESTFENSKHKDPEDWAKLKRFVDRFAAKKVKDPCPICRWWGGVTCDIIPEHWTCPLQPPETLNSFCYVQR